MENGVLTEYDLMEIQAEIDAQYPQTDEPTEGLEDAMVVES